MKYWRKQKNKELSILKSQLETVHNEQRAQKRDIEKLNTRLDEYETMLAFLEGNRLGGLK